MAALRIFARGYLVAAATNPVQPLNRAAPLILQIQKRWGNYTASPRYKKPEDYTDYEITNDPNEWKYVERALRYKIIPKPPVGDVKLPSGFKPASASPTDYPYFIERTRNYLQPVYLYRNTRGTIKVTTIHKIQGDIWQLERDVKQYVEEHMGKKKLASQIHEFAGIIKFKGDCVNRVKEWMNTKGF